MLLLLLRLVSHKGSFKAKLGYTGNKMCNELNGINGRNGIKRCVHAEGAWAYLEGVGFKPPKWISFFYKSINMHKNTPKINITRPTEIPKFLPHMKFCMAISLRGTRRGRFFMTTFTSVSNLEFVFWYLPGLTLSKLTSNKRCITVSGLNSR